MANPFTLLQHIGGAVWNFLKKANVVVKEGSALAQIAEPVVDLMFPALAPLYNMTVGAVVNAEAAGQAATNASTGDGAQKAALVLQSIKPIFVAYYESQFGVTPTDAQIQAYIDAVVAMLNALPAPVKTPAVAPVASK